MRRKLNMDVEKEKKIDYRKLGMYLFDFTGNSTFPTPYQKLLFSLAHFSAFFPLY